CLGECAGIDERLGTIEENRVKNRLELSLDQPLGPCAKYRLLSSPGILPAIRHAPAKLKKTSTKSTGLRKAHGINLAKTPIGQRSVGIGTASAWCNGQCERRPEFAGAAFQWVCNRRCRQGRR